MSMKYIRDYYGVPAKRSMRVEVDGKPGVIVGSVNASLKVRLDGQKHSVKAHPRWRVTYLDSGTEKR